MYRTINILPFPKGGRDGETALTEADKAAVQKRVDALPQTVRDLDVAWIFEETARRDKKAGRRR